CARVEGRYFYDSGHSPGRLDVW
nr:immunoglobulin heavy chain junction region [Macaca mulatta]